jgi:hypothetical protein
VSAHDIPVIDRADLLRATAAPIPARWKTISLALTVVGLLVFVAGLFLGAADRVWRAWHFNWLFFTVISSAAGMFVAIQRITTARWSRPIIRLLEGYTAFLPVAFVLLALTLTLGAGHVFPWTWETPPVASKVFYLQHWFVTVRSLVAFGLITLLTLWFVYLSVRLDVGGLPEAGAGWARGLRARMRNGYREERREIHSTHSTQGKIAVVLALAFGYGWCSLLFDLSMALNMHFQSALYGWWGFMTGWLGMLMSWTMLTMAWRDHLNAEHLIQENHFHDLGKLCFAFTAFWGYLTFSQLLVIWYGNMPEETHYFRTRLIEPYLPITFSLAFLVFLAPFLGLMSRMAKIYRPTMILFAVCSLVGTWLQRYIEVYPSLYGVTNDLPFGLWEVGVGLFYLGLWALCYISFMDAFPRVRHVLMTSPYRDEVQVPCDPETMLPLPAHE